MRWVTAVCWVASALLAAWAAVRWFGLERGYPLVPLLAFTPYAAASGVLVVLAALALRRRRAAVLAVAAVVALAAAVVPRGLGGAGDADGAGLRVLSANVHFGEVPAAALVTAVRRERVDVLSVQELTPSLSARLERAGLRRMLPHAVLEPWPGGGGTGLYARVPLEPRPTPPGTAFAWAAARASWRGRDVEVVAVHPTPPTEARIEQWAADMRRLPRAPRSGSRILAGDFNATLDHAALRAVLASGYTDAADSVGAGWRTTWPLGRRFPPPVTIDHVLVDRHWTTRSVRLLKLPRTDHAAVLAEVVPAARR